MIRLLTGHPWGVFRRNKMNTFIKDENGATAVEYGMITGLMFGLIMTAWGGTYSKMADAFEVIVTTLSVA